MGKSVPASGDDVLEFVSEQELESIRQRVSASELEAFATVDRVLNREWFQSVVFDFASPPHCYDLAILGELARLNGELVDNHWIVVQAEDSEDDSSRAQPAR